MRRRRLALVVAGSAMAAALIGCSAEPTGSSTSGHGPAPHAGSALPHSLVERLPGREAHTARGAVETMFAAYNRKELDRWLGAWSDEGYLQAFGVTKQEAALVPPSWGDARSFRESQVKVLDLVEHGQHDRPTGSAGGEHGDGEHVTVDTVEAGIVTRQRLDLVPQQGIWRVSGRTLLPSHATGPVLHADLFDHAVVLSEPRAAADLVLRVRNRGAVPHELLLLRRRGGLDETVGRTGLLPPGEVRDLVGRDLPPGEYALVCNELDRQGRPHSTLGMRVPLAMG